MKHFFYVVFGGLGAMLAAVIIWFGVTFVWTSLVHVTNNKITVGGVASNIGMTTVSGFYRTIRYSADEEEDMINEAALSLPNGGLDTVSAKSYIIRDLSSNKVIKELDSNRQMPIASITKLVTAVVAHRLISQNTRITFNKKEIDTIGNTGNIVAGETFSAGDLMYPLLMVSSNDAAEAYAQSFGRVRFIRAMNDFVQSIGAYRTYFADPSGLDPSNVSTASDYAIILDWIYKNEKEIIDITKLKSYTVRSHTWVNPTHFLSWSYYAGGKNGYTSAAMNTAASLFNVGPNKDLYAIVILGTKSRDTDMIKLLKETQR